MQRNIIISAWLGAAGLFGLCASGATYYVDNVKGADGNAGSAAAPFSTIERGIAALKTSDRLEVANNPGKPYVRPYPGPQGLDYQITAGGTAAQPLVINGNGAVISGLAEVPADKWKKAGERIYSLPFWPMSNMYRNYTAQDYWNPALKIWFIDGKNAVNCLSRQEMEKTPGGFWWSRAERAVYFHLPDGKTLNALKIQLPANSGFYTTLDHCRIENFTSIFSWNDGFDTGNTPRNTIYKNCVAIDNCGQGFSCHGESLALYEDCVAVRCGSAGSCNAHNSQASYVRCVFMNNVFEAGVFNYGTAFSRFYDSLVIDNRPSEQIWAHGSAGFLFSNCVIKAAGTGQPVAFVRNGGLTMKRCTVIGGLYFNVFGPGALGTVNLSECLLGGMAKFVLDVRPGQYQLANNIYFDSPGIRMGSRMFAPADLAAYQQASKGDAGSSWSKNIPPNPATGVPDAIRPSATVRVGAILPDSVWAAYRKYRNVRATPDGVVFPEDAAAK